VYGGDDGLTADVDPAKYVKAGALVGQVLTLTPVSRGALGVKFLARCYGPDVWFGDISSCCDIRRQITKIHTTVALPTNVTPEMKLVEKARAFFLTDANTPVIGDFTRMVLLYSGGVPDTKFLRIWNSDLPSDVQYPNEPREWYMDVVLKDMPEFSMEVFTNWISTIASLSDCLKPPICHPEIIAKSKIEVVVDDDIVKPKEKPQREMRPRVNKGNVKRGNPPVRGHRGRGRAKR